MKMVNCDSVAVTPGDHADRQPFANTNLRYYEQLVDCVSDAIISLDQNLIIRSLNKAAERLYGWTAEEAVGRHAVELVHAEFPTGSYNELYDRLMEQGRLEFEMVHTARDGRKITVLSDTVLLRDGKGDTVGCVAIMRDIMERKLLEEKLALQAVELKRKENDLREMLEGAAEDAWIMDFEQNSFICSQELLKRADAGSSNGKQLMHYFMELVHPEDQDTVYGYIRRCISERQTAYEMEYRQKAKGGYVWKQTRGKLSYDAAGRLLKMHGYSHDITKRKNAELKIERQAKELELAKGLLEEDLNAMNRLHSISTRFVQKQELPSLMDEIINAAMEATHADMCSIQAIDVQTCKLRVVASSGLPEGFADILDAIHNVAGIGDRVNTLENRFVIANTAGVPSVMGECGNTTMQTAGIGSIHCTPLMNRSGRKLGALAIYFREPHQTEDRDLRFLDLLARLTADIMERSNAEELIQHGKKSTEILYEVVEKLLEGDHVQEIIQEICTKVMHFLDCDMFVNYLASNDDPKMMRPFAWSGISGKRPSGIGTIMRNRFVCGSAAESGARIVLENVQNCGDKKAAHLISMGIRAYACHPLMVKDEVLGTLSFGSKKKDSFDEGELALMRAVSGHVAVALNRMRIGNDLKELAEELREKNKLVTDFFTNISHEFKTPLSIILVDLQLMEYRLKGVGGEAQDKLEKMIAVMRQNALRLLRLIGNLLDVTKIDAGFMKARLVNTDFVSLISGLVESVRDYAENAGIIITFESGIDAKMIPLDTEKMERVMLNLLSNAIKHTPEGGHISVAAKSGGNSVTVSVRDDGEGIPEDKKEYIFDRFRQVNTSLTRSSEGCGIGLSLTKALVELLRGRIWFESRLGSGSEFFVELPVLAENENSHTPEVEGMPRNRKVEMEFSDIHKAGRQI